LSSVATEVTLQRFEQDIQVRTQAN